MHPDTEWMNVLAARGDENRLRGLLSVCLVRGHDFERRWLRVRCFACGRARDAGQGSDRVTARTVSAGV